MKKGAKNGKWPKMVKWPQKRKSEKKEEEKSGANTLLSHSNYRKALNTA